MKLQIRDNHFRRPKPHVGYKFKGKSMTIPGQELTPQEILRNFVQKRMPDGSLSNSGYFEDLELDQFGRMDEMDRLDLIREKRKETEALREDLRKLTKAEYEKQQEKIRSPQDPPPPGDVKDAEAPTGA